MIKITETQVKTLEAMQVQAKAGQIGYWQIYQWLADTLVKQGVAKADSTVLWLRGATEANANRGAMATLIRSYTQSQYQLRYGRLATAAQMQAASNAVAEALIADIKGISDDKWLRGDIPDISRIADKDATAVGQVLFNIAADTAAPTTPNNKLGKNSAWAGALLFSQLRSNQTYRLFVSSDASKVDTLNDMRDILYAYKAYAQGLKDARANFLSSNSTAAQKIIDGSILGQTAFAYVKGTGTIESLYTAIFTGTDNPVLQQVFAGISNVGENKFLDMLIGASLGYNAIGATTNANFNTRAISFFNGITPQKLQSLKATLLPNTMPDLIALAKIDVNVRVALFASSNVSVAVASNVAAKFSLYNTQTQLGEITEQWIKDKAYAQIAFNLYDKNNETDGILSVAGLPLSTQLGDIRLTIEGSENRKQTLIVDGVDLGLILQANYYFGNDANNTATGLTGDDHLYGGAGNDTLNGAAGNDYLEGNSGNDSLNGGDGNDSIYGGAGNDNLNGGDGTDYLEGGTGDDIYQFDSTKKGIDSIKDAQGSNQVVLDNQTLSVSFSRMASLGGNIYTSLDKTYQLRLIETSTQAWRLSKKTSTGDYKATMDISGWQSGQFGFTLGADKVDDARITLSFPASIAYMNMNAAGATKGVYLQAGTKSSSFTGSSYSDIIITSSGSSNYVNAYGGDDKIQGNIGKDYIRGGVNLTPSGNITDNDIITGGANTDIILGGGGDDQLWGEDASNTYLSTIANSSSTGDWVSGELGNDQIIGSAQSDALFGGAGQDISQGGAGNDLILGDASYTPSSKATALPYALGLTQAFVWNAASSDLARTNEFDYALNPVVVASGTAFNWTWSVDATTNDFTLTNPAGLIGNMRVATGGDDDVLNGGAGNDWMAGQTGNDILIGGEGNDILFGDDLLATDISSGNDTLTGGAGNDKLNGGIGSDKYFFESNFGRDGIVDYSIATEKDSMHFKGITSKQLWFKKLNSFDLEVSVIGTDNAVTVKDWYKAAANQIESIQVESTINQTLTNNNVDKLVQAMAAFAPPKAGQTTLPSDYANKLNVVLAANWA